MVKGQLILDCCHLTLLDSIGMLSYQASTQLKSTQLLLTWIKHAISPDLYFLHLCQHPFWALDKYFLHVPFEVWGNSAKFAQTGLSTHSE